MAPVRGQQFSSDMSDVTDTPYQGLDRDELTRLMIQALSDMGYESTARELAQESGLRAGDHAVVEFIQLLYAGSFAKAEDKLDALELGLSEGEMGVIRYLIKREQFVELVLVDGDESAALHVLRAEMNPLTIPPDALRNLSAFLMNSDNVHLWNMLGWLGSVEASREHLVESVSKHISPDRLLPPHRLATMLNQAVTFQRERESYYVKDRQEDNNVVSLYQDFRADRSQFPSRVIKTLTAHTGEVWFVRFSNTGKYLCSASSDSNVVVYDVENSFRVYKELSGSEKAVMYCSWSPDDSKLLTCGLDLNIRMWDVASGNCLALTSLGDRSRIWACEWLPDSSGCLVGSPDKRLFLFNPKLEILYQWPVADTRITDLAVFPNGKSFITVNQNHSAYVYDIESRAMVKEIKIRKKLTSVTVSSDSKFCIINVAPEEVQLWNLTNYTLVRKYYGQQQARYVIRSCFGNWDDSFILSGSEDGRVYIWNREFGNLIHALEGHKELVNCVDWNRNGTGYNSRIFATAGDDKTVKIWGV